ncbi:MAG: cellulose biosynthesis cyclic di-GMP-binding regulatory protein BcsB [Anaerolineae bacterium]
MFCILGLPARVAIAQGGNTFEITLAELGYDDSVMKGPLSATRFYFGLPSTWALRQGGYLALHLEYVAAGHESDPPAFLRVSMNDTLLRTEALETSDGLRLLIYFPPDTLLATDEQNINTLKLELEVDEECERALLVSLTVKNSSFLHFAYRRKPVQPNLALYPAPLYQPQALEQGELRFVLPSEPTAAELEAAAMIAARLGQLTVGQMPISTVLSSDLQGVAPQEHLLIVGQPEDQPSIRQLDLPVPVVERRLALRSEMPSVIDPAEAVSYRLAVANTSEISQSLVVEDRLPAGGKLISCSEPCTEARPGAIRWEIGPLAPGAEASTTVTLEIELPLPSQEGGTEVAVPTIEHTASLLDAQGNVLNVDSLSARVGSATSETWVSSEDEEIGPGSSYMFALEGQGVSETDGLVQEIASPWRSDRAVIVVTGLDGTALLKAARSLGGDNHFPGMWGSYGLVQATHPISESVPIPAESTSFASLGYQDDSLSNLYLEYLEYRFQMPAGWELGDDAYLALHFSHGTALNDMEATLEVQLNGLPIGSLYLEESNSSDSWAAIPLASSATRAGTNRIRIRVSADQEHICAYITSDRYWLTAFDDSFLHLPRQAGSLDLSLDQLPYPFANSANLTGVAFLLPEQPSSVEVEGMLRLAFQMGSLAGGQDFGPRVALGGEPAAEAWADYDLVVLGSPTDNRYLDAANEQLPQPFEPGTNEVQQVIDTVIFRLAPGTSLGLVQELISPWDQSRAMLAVTGTNEEGVAWAVRALTDEEIQGELFGNLAAVREEETWSIDTRQSTPEDLAVLAQGMGLDLLATVTTTPTVAPVSATPTQPATAEASPPPTLEPTPLPSTTPTPLPTVTPAPPAAALPEASPSPAASAQPPWLGLLLVLSGLTVVVGGGLALWQSRK